MAQLPQPNPWKEVLRRPHPLDLISMDEIQAAWEYFTSLPRGHYNRIHIIAEFSSPWERGSWFHYYTIQYLFRNNKKTICEFAVSPKTAKQLAILKIFKKTELDITEAPIPTYLPQRVQEKIRKRREVPQQRNGTEEDIGYDADDEDEG